MHVHVSTQAEFYRFSEKYYDIRTPRSNMLCILQGTQINTD